MKHEAHSFNKKICHWDYCSRCGLVALKNEPTDKAIKLGCNWSELMGKRK